jgi:hypothetical protein
MGGCVDGHARLGLGYCPARHKARALRSDGAGALMLAAMISELNTALLCRNWFALGFYCVRQAPGGFTQAHG